MKLIKSLNYLKNFCLPFKADNKQIIAIGELLKKLKSREQKLVTGIEEETDSERRKQIERDLKIVRAQQKKGEKIIAGF